MSVTPYGPSQLTPRDIGMQFALTQMAKSPTDEAFGMGAAGNLAIQVGITIKEAVGLGAQRMGQTLKQLEELGYNSDSEVAKDVVHCEKQVNELLLKIGEAVGRRL